MTDAINSPSHYRGADGTEEIDVIEMQFGIAGHLPQAVAYILRHQRKGTPAADLAKARWYVRRAILLGGGVRTHISVDPALVDDVINNFGIGVDAQAAWALRHICCAASADDHASAMRHLARAEDSLARAVDDLADHGFVPGRHRLPDDAPVMAASPSPHSTS